MNIETDDADRRVGDETHARFAQLPHAKHIASRWSLRHMSALLVAIRPKRTLEAGAGIGALTSLLAASPGNEVVAVEPVAEFAQECKRNTGVEPLPDFVGVDGHFDLFVLDGSFGRRFVDLMKPGSVIFVEGARGRQRRELSGLLAKRGLAPNFVSYVPDHKARKGSSKGCHIGVVGEIGTPA